MKTVFRVSKNLTTCPSLLSHNCWTYAEMQKAASTSSMLVLFFLTNCANVWAVDAQRLCNCYFLEYQHAQLVQLCYFLGFAMAQLVQASTVWRYVINTDGTKALSQTQNTISGFWEAQIRNYAILSQI